MNKEILEHLINVENMTYMLLNDEQKKIINDDKIKNLEAKKRIYQKEIEKLEKKVILDRTHLTEIRHEETKIPRYIPSYEELQQELERYKNIIKETIEKSRCIFEDKTINDDEAFYQLGCVIDKLENVIGGEK